MNTDNCKQRLSLIKNYKFFATSNKDDGLNGTGLGTVSIETDPINNTLLFFEEGHFENARGRFKSHNIYKWTFKAFENCISLEHLRFGAENAVYLFDMVYDDHNLWSSKCPHLCDKDEYHAKMLLSDSFITLDWDIVNKVEHIHIKYQYF